MAEGMSRDQLEVYRGSWAKPSDFDVFWDQQVALVPEETRYQLVEKDFSLDGVRCYDLRFQAVDGSEIYAKAVFPKKLENVPVVFMFHGYHGRSKDWTDLFPYAATGHGVVALDVRGQAGKSEDLGVYKGSTVKGHIVRGLDEGRDHLYFRKAFLDVYQLVEVVASMDFVDASRLSSYGDSQGGALALVAAALNPKINLTVAIYPFLSDFKRVIETVNNTEAYNELFRYFFLRDPLHLTEEKVLDTLAYIDVKNFASRIKGQVKMITGLLDDVCLPSTQYAIYNNLGTDNKEHYLMPEYGHEPMHYEIKDYVFNWITGATIVPK
ncbi:alpha/beta fold hydrolase [Fundicoccus culcitae]|uniref:Acetylxylan esterase n=1 Tax=Fundicoccus culcitae TaxID=2969821 RepID=A0ABY5P9V3_9LACT|nr:alpha/beta fold hydrolase [Fundicoccus culcitae]UUX35128.1 acetylxylan esterase [Fundicoccus culcitae]